MNPFAISLLLALGLITTETISPVYAENINQSI